MMFRGGFKLDTFFFTGVVASLLLISVPIAASEEGHHHDNHAAIMLGGMTPLSEKSETSFALGGDYSRILSNRWEVGGGVDLVFGDHKRNVLVEIGAGYRLVGTLKLKTGPGFEVVEIDQADGTTKTKLYPVWGVGGSYDFFVGSISISPALYFDFVGETKTNATYGLAFGTGF